jgi:hypothetical protein
MATHSVDAAFAGSVFEVHLSLEQQPFKLQRDPVSGQFVGHADALEIPGDLRVKLQGKAMNGTQWSLRIKIDGHGHFEESGTARSGTFGFDEVPVPLHCKDA